MSIDRITFTHDGIHDVNFSRFDSETGTVWCDKCEQMIDAFRWARPCEGKQP